MVEKVTTANELKPCGCGCVNIDVGQRKRVGYKRFTAKCIACHTQTTPLNTKEKAIRAWNNAMSGALSAPPPAVAPPKKATEEMIAAGWIDKEDVDPGEIWFAMYAKWEETTASEKSNG